MDCIHTVCCAVSCNNNVEKGEMSVNQLIKRAQLILSVVLPLLCMWYME